jgi:outer membrane receptor protein involved in Fe transport
LNYGLQYRTSFGGGFNDLQTFAGDTTFFSNQTRDFNRSGISNNIRFGADYNFSEKSTLTTGMTYRFGEDNNDNEVIYRDFINNAPLGVTVRSDDEFEDESNLEYFITHTQKFRKKGHELITDVRFSDNVEVESSDFTETYFDNDLNPSGIANLLQRSRNDEGNQQLQVQIDYIKPLGGKDQKFEMGLRSSLRDIRNEYLVEEFDDVRWKSLEGLSNNFIYDENIHSLYAIYGNKIKKFSYQVGLRGELTDLYTELEQTNEVNDTTYAGLFPSVFLGYEAGDQNAFQISYSRRLRRPRFWDLNPFFTFSDARNFFSGNPNIGPENTDSYELSHIKYWGNASLTTSLYYRHSTDVIERITFVNPDGTSLTQPQNLSTQNDFGLEFTYNFQPYKWWRINGNFNFFRSITDGGNLGESFAADTYSWFKRITSQTTVWKDLDIQLRGNYRAPRQTTQGRSQGIASLDIALSKDIFKKNGSITLSVRDVFNSRKRRYIQEGPNFIREGEFQWRARTAILTINYRLNQKKQRYGGQRGGGYEGGDSEF